MSCLVQRRIRGGALRLNLARLIGVSRYVCERHVRAGVVPRERAQAIRLGALPGRSRLRALDGDDVRLGFIGTLGTHKGVRTLLEAFRRAPASWRLTIAGTGQLVDEVTAAAAADPRITYLGHVEGDAKDDFFDGLDLVVIPSEWEEPATFVAVESASRGIPAVVSHRGGLPEAPEARTFRSGDAEELLRAVNWFVEEPARLSVASTRLLDNKTEYEWATHVARVEALLDEVLDERARART